MTPLQLHEEKWSDCTRCSLCEVRRKRDFVTLWRGVVPADIVFVGEAPGKTESSRGRPFIGEAGRLLNLIIRESVPTDIDYALTNLVGCLPVKDGDKQEPEDEAIKTCGERLVEFVTIAQPRLIVCVGKHATHWLNPEMKESIKIGSVPRISIVHPSAILRAPIVQKSLLRRKCEITIRDGILEHLKEGK